MDSFLPELYQTVKNSLDNKTPPENATEITANNQVENNFFTTTNYQFNNCLVVNWDKKLDGDGKWYGSFRYLWGFSHGSQALIVFNSLEASLNETKLKVTGGVYFVKQGGKNGTQWLMHKYKKWQEPSTLAIDAKDFENKFPKVGDGIPEKNQFSEGQDYWGFVTGKDDLNKICTNCQEEKLTTHKKFRGKWEWSDKSGGTNKPIDWVKSPDWFSHLYSDISNFKTLLTNKFANMKGNWVKKELQLI